MWTAFGLVALAAIACSSSAATVATSAPNPTVTPVLPVGSDATPIATPAPLLPTPTPEPTKTPAPLAQASRTPVIDNIGDTTNRIVFVSPDLQIYTVKPDGSSQIRISPSRGTFGQGTLVPGYTWPGWSPDGSSILYSATLPAAISTSPYVLLATAADGSSTDSPDVLYQNEPGTGLIVAGGPHYGVWSPDSKKVASIVSTPNGLSVILADTENERVFQLVPGAPLYLSWSPDSSQLLVHVGDRLLRFDAPFTAVSAALDGGSNRYFAPTYAPNDSRAAFLVDDEDGTMLFVQDQDAGTLTPLTEIEVVGWFRWAPDGESLAVLKGNPFANESTIWRIAADGSSEELLASGRYLMLMWSPDGKKMLLAQRSAEISSRFVWSVMDLATREINDLIEFTPSGEIEQLHLFFDQYSASHTFWSPDSSSIVFTGLLHEPLSRLEDRTRGDDTVWVVKVDGSEPPRAVGDGFLAFWSPK